MVATPRGARTKRTPSGTDTDVREQLLELAVADRFGRIERPIGALPVYTVTPVARQIFGAQRYYAVRRFFYTNFSRDYSIDVYNRSGELQRIVRAIASPAVVSQGEIDDHRSAEVRQRLAISRREGGDLDSAATDAVLFRGRLPAKQHPLISGLAVDAAENLWVRDYRPREDGVLSSRPDVAGAAQLWRVFDPQGKAIATIEVPDQFQITEIGADYVAGIWRDALFVESARIYALVK